MMPLARSASRKTVASRPSSLRSPRGVTEPDSSPIMDLRPSADANESGRVPYLRLNSLRSTRLSPVACDPV